jgi:hypothetical protein
MCKSSLGETIVINSLDGDTEYMCYAATLDCGGWVGGEDEVDSICVALFMLLVDEKKTRICSFVRGL